MIAGPSKSLSLRSSNATCAVWLVGTGPSVATLCRFLTGWKPASRRVIDRIQGVNAVVYKVRLRNSDAQRGKSGGYRVVYYVRKADHVILLTIYSESDQGDVSPQTLRRIIEDE